MRFKLVSTVLLNGLLSHLALAQHDLENSPVRATFPQQPALKVCSESTVVGSVTSQNYSLAGKNYRLVLSTSQLPPMVLNFRSPDSLYKEASDALLREHSGAQQESFGVTTVVGKAGAEMCFKKSNGDNGKARFVLVGQKLVVAEALWSSPDSQREAERFLNSLTISQ